jgi:ABC-2 type transport system ATP-binding protein
MEHIQFWAKDVLASYGKFSVSKISFYLKSSDILGIVGRSGSGKSTLIKTLIGIKKPDSGEIIAAINREHVLLREVVGYSPQENSLYPFLTVEENLKTFGQLYGLDKSTIKNQIDLLLKRLDLEGSREKRIVQLSGGMQKRADLAVSLIHSPKIIILDEPFAGLDISLQTFIWKFLRELSKEGNIIIVSSHMIEDVQKYCNQFGLVEQGLYYNTSQISRTLKTSKEKNLESYLEKLFMRDLTKHKVR